MGQNTRSITLHFDNSYNVWSILFVNSFLGLVMLKPVHRIGESIKKGNNRRCFVLLFSKLNHTIHIDIVGKQIYN